MIKRTAAMLATNTPAPQELSDAELSLAVGGEDGGGDGGDSGGDSDAGVDTASLGTMCMRAGDYNYGGMGDCYGNATANDPGWA